MSISDRFAEYRRHIGLDKQTFAKELGVAKAVVYAIEAGKREVSRGLILRIAELGVDMNWLLTGEGEMFRGENSVENDGFRSAVPDVYSLYKENQELKRAAETSEGCRLCPKVNRMDRERSVKLEGYADALLMEQDQEGEAGRPVEAAGPSEVTYIRKESLDSEAHEPVPEYGSAEELINTPLLGQTAAGPPLDTQGWPDEWRRVRLRKREDPRSCYLLEVTGTSMVDAGIPNRSLILVRRAEEGSDGQIVIAHEPQEGVTLKRLARDGERRVLQWQDGSQRHLEVTEHTRIQGVFVRVVE